MTNKLFIALMSIGLTVSTVAAAGTPAADDAVAASFMRMLNHEPHHGPTQTTVPTRQADPIAAIVRRSLLRNDLDSRPVHLPDRTARAVESGRRAQ